ncbi:MAG: nucleotide exchange factor GrpE [Deltaproteobacteria bacterium]|nr:nucleotide exchange factor GrpE [Deltaproteobacteria bacterium]
MNPDTPFPGASPEDKSPVVDPGPAIDFDAVVFPENGEIAPEKQREETAVERCPNCAEAEKGRLMALAELENARKRLAREKEEFIKYAGEGVIADILPALDNLDLALAYAPQSEDCRNFVIGVDMTRKLLLDALTRRGLQQTGELGEDFDPACHEAVGMEAHPEYADGQVCALLSKGYRMKERLLRPAKVKVCKKDGL